jgi:2-polyprenyl-3-methyl-5-hydroxy-6-metoxy-1,4-benzoquinol methylase
VNSIPRFAEAGYVQSFGLQWNEYRNTQLDSFNGTSISKNRLERLLGGPLNILKGKEILEAGCGAGLFTEVMLAAGANVFAVDLSQAVEANYANRVQSEWV